MIITKVKRIINIDDISSELKNKIDEMVIDPHIDEVTINPKIKKLLSEINNKITNNIKLKDIINKENKYLRMLKEAVALNGDFFIEGKMQNIPAIKGNYIMNFKYDNSVYISGIAISMSGWKPEDTWELEVDKRMILSNIPTREIGEERLLRSVKFVDINKDINVIFHNNSGNSRQIWCDLQYIKPLN